MLASARIPPASRGGSLLSSPVILWRYLPINIHQHYIRRYISYFGVLRSPTAAQFRFLPKRRTLPNFEGKTFLLAQYRKSRELMPVLVNFSRVRNGEDGLTASTETGAVGLVLLLA